MVLTVQFTELRDAWLWTLSERKGVFSVRHGASQSREEVRAVRRYSQVDVRQF